MRKERSYGLTGVVLGLLAVGIVAGGLGVWSWWTGESVLPYERAAGAVRAGVVEPVGRVCRGVDGSVEKGRMEEELEGLKVRVAELERAEMENVRLREALGFVEERRGRLVAARVVSRGGGSGWWRVVRLEKGSEAGIQVGDGVVTSAGLVGRVRVVTPRTCEVMLVSDGNSRVGCELEERSETRRGVVIGGEGRLGEEGMRFVYGPTSLEMRYIGGETEPAAGTRVVTSGLGGDLPQGILVGVVEKGERTQGGVAFSATVRPAVNLRDLDVVFVLVKK